MLLHSPAQGTHNLAELRTVETLLHGNAITPFLRFGDIVRIEMTDAGGQSIFGSIEQRVMRREHDETAVTKP